MDRDTKIATLNTSRTDAEVLNQDFRNFWKKELGSVKDSLLTFAQENVEMSSRNLFVGMSNAGENERIRDAELKNAHIQYGASIAFEQAAKILDNALVAIENDLAEFEKSQSDDGGPPL